eukprot:scaffold51490_cov20-Tisochrysis_lutea.AAC.2
MVMVTMVTTVRSTWSLTATTETICAQSTCDGNPKLEVIAATSTTATTMMMIVMQYPTHMPPPQAGHHPRLDQRSLPTVDVGVWVPCT